MVTRLAFGRLYPIVDLPRLPSPDALALAKALLDAGVPWLQLRRKGAASGEHLEIARELVALAARAGARVIVNDRVDVALLTGAAGAHLGQGDLPLPAARRLAAGRLILGVSTHSVAQARQAEADGADYIGFGPMFPTGSKPDALAPRDPAELRAVRAAVSLPVVAIGGISEATAPAVLAAGADAVAVIGALRASSEPRELATRLMRL